MLVARCKHVFPVADEVKSRAGVARPCLALCLDGVEPCEKQCRGIASASAGSRCDQSPCGLVLAAFPAWYEGHVRKRRRPEQMILGFPGRL
ncbi:hypothetical protein SMICM304S_01200 [Streptomyces microflavus]